MAQFDTTRLFLTRVLPWYPVGDPDAYFSIHWTAPNSNPNGKPYFNGTVCKTLDDCIETVKSRLSKLNTLDIWVALASQRDIEIAQRKDGKGTFQKPIRIQENVVHLRSLFVDIDVKAGAYPSQQAALAALLQFCKDSGLPRFTLLVSSGSGGIHAYWTLDEALPRDVWQPLADALAEATRRCKLITDTQCTIDSARVMRVPETRNSKTGGTVTLANHMLQQDYTLDQMRAALAPYMGAKVYTLTPKGKPGPADELSAGIEVPQAQPVALKSIADAGCGFIKEAIDTGGKNYANPLWNLTTLVSVFTEGGREDAHMMASGHPSYSQEETDAQYDRKVMEHEKRGLGWPHCSAVENAGCTHCSTCAIRKPDSKPLQFGTSSVIKLPVPAPGDLPFPYSRDQNGHIKTQEYDKNTKKYKIVTACPYVCERPWVQQTPWSLNFETTLVPGHAPIQIAVTNVVAATGESFAKHMASQGMAMPSKTMARFREFILSWSRHLQYAASNVVQSAPYGWNYEDGKLSGFCYGGREYSPQGERQASMADPIISMQYRPAGYFNVWQDAVKIITDLKSPAHNALLCSSFAAPLVELIGLEGVLVFAWSLDSGAGKTVAMKLGQAVWSPPGGTKQDLDDTANSIFGKLATLKALPVYWDEMPAVDPEMFVRRVFKVSLGSERGRMTQDAKLKEKRTWHTIMLAAANMSCIETIAAGTRTTPAGVFRVFEWNVPKVPTKMAPAIADYKLAQLDHNYGHAGKIYAEYLGKNIAQVQKEVIDFRLKIYERLKMENDERFWSLAVACIYMGGKYAKQLGLIDIDENEMLRFLVGTLQNMRGYMGIHALNLTNAASLANILHQYIEDRRHRQTIITDVVWTTKGRPTKGAVKLLSPLDKCEKLNVHIAKQAQLMRFSMSDFREYLQSKKILVDPVITSLENAFGARREFAKLGSGTGIATMQQIVVEINLAHPKLVGLVEY